MHLAVCQFPGLQHAVRQCNADAGHQRARLVHCVFSNHGRVCHVCRHAKACLGAGCGQLHLKRDGCAVAAAHDGWLLLEPASVMVGNSSNATCGEGIEKSKRKG